MRKNQVTVGEAEAGKNLDSWLAERFSYNSLEQWQEEITSGRVTINGEATSTSELLTTNDSIEYKPKRRPEPEVNLSYETIYEDRDILIINKPGNLPCHPSGVFFKNTLWSLLKEKYEKFHFINRLDRETSGLMVIALNKEAAGNLGKQVADRTVTKKYQLIVHGVLQENIEGVGWLGKDPESEVRKKRKFFPKTINSTPEDEWEEATTWFLPKKNNGKLTLVDVKIGTGRFHQIRATSYSLGFPVVGDKIYGVNDQLYLRFISQSLTEEDHQTLILERQALHASFLSFTHPTSGENVCFYAPFSEGVLQKLQFFR